MPTKTKKPKATAALAAAPQANGTVAAENMTLAEAAAWLRVPDDGLRADAVAGRIPARLIAGEWRFNKPALVVWLSQPEPPAEKSSKERMLAVAGLWKDDPTVDAMVEEIYRKRKADPVGGK